MAVVAATEFARNFRVYNLQAQSEPVKVTNHGKVDGAYISARDLEILETAKSRLRKRYVAGEIPAEVIELIKQAKMPEEHAHLYDDLNIDWSKEGLVHYGDKPAPENKD